MSSSVQRDAFVKFNQYPPEIKANCSTCRTKYQKLQLVTLLQCGHLAHSGCATLKEIKEVVGCCVWIKKKKANESPQEFICFICKDESPAISKETYEKFREIRKGIFSSQPAGTEEKKDFDDSKEVYIDANTHSENVKILKKYEGRDFSKISKQEMDELSEAMKQVKTYQKENDLGALMDKRLRNKVLNNRPPEERDLPVTEQEIIKESLKESAYMNRTRDCSLMFAGGV